MKHRFFYSIASRFNFFKVVELTVLPQELFFFVCFSDIHFFQERSSPNHIIIKIASFSASEVNECAEV